MRILGHSMLVEPNAVAEQNIFIAEPEVCGTLTGLVIGTQEGLPLFVTKFLLERRNMGGEEVIVRVDHKVTPATGEEDPGIVGMFPGDLDVRYGRTSVQQRRDARTVTTLEGYAPAASQLVALLASAEGGSGPGWELEVGDVVTLVLLNGSPRSAAVIQVPWSIRVEQQCMFHEDCRIYPKLGRDCLKKRSRRAARNTHELPERAAAE